MYKPTVSLFRTCIVVALVISVLPLCGCRSGNLKGGNLGRCNDEQCSTSIPSPRTISYPDLECASELKTEFASPPLTDPTELPEEMFPLSLDEALRLGFDNTKILRGIGARVLDNPEGAPSTLDPAIQSTDPFFGIEGALSQFDAVLSGDIGYANNDDVFNNAITGGGANEIQQDLFRSSMSLNKTTATGTQFALRGSLQHDRNNAPNNLFNHAWTTLVEAEARQPLLQGRGLMFNRIAGPNARPGFRGTSGVLIARINNDISIAKFERNVEAYVDEVIQAYWELFFAYRNFESSKSARDGALKTWNTVKARFDNELPGGEADKEAEAREQYYVFQGQLLDALNGNNRGSTGVLQAESNLRRLLNLPQSDGLLIYPSDSPTAVGIAFDWNQLAHDTLRKRVELREQQWRIKQRELELLASRNFTLPRVDAVATYRNNGFGDDLTGGSGRFSSAAKTAIEGLYDEWEIGLQYNVPIGFRQASAGVKNSELKLLRERELLQEQQREILHALGTAVRQSKRTHATIEVAGNRMNAARDTVDARLAAFEDDQVPFDELLNAQRRLAEAEVQYYRELVNVALAAKQVSRESGRLLADHSIYLQESDLRIQTANPDRRRRKLEKGLQDYRVASPGFLSRR